MLLALVGCDDAASTLGDAAPLPDARPVDAANPPDVCFRSPEICNGEDDDCDQLVDEADPDLAVKLFDDPENCGRCGQVCAAAHGQTVCTQARCFLTGCEAGFYDYDGRVENGCESNCRVTAGGVEICDGLDNNCNGQIDEGFFLDTDIDNCGSCGNVCAFEQGVSACAERVCVLAECLPGWIDADHDPLNGCEYACTPTVAEPDRELCNGVDDDCDGTVDEPFGMEWPENFCGELGICAAQCEDSHDCWEDERCHGGVCVPLVVPELGCETDEDCQTVHSGLACLEQNPIDAPRTRRCAPRKVGPVCDGTAGFRCAFPTIYQAGTEAGRCDGLDNDCDGQTDEDFAELLFLDGETPRLCEAQNPDGTVAQGACRRTAAFECSPDGLSVICPVSPGVAADIDDDCDGVDDDCDGEIDEDFEDAWVALSGFAIYAYEASRPGATERAAGLDPRPDDAVVSFVETRACSRAAVLPWADVSQATAQAACEAAGARLCTDAEWTRACGGAGGTAYPYGSSYGAALCNGGAYDASALPGDQDLVLPTGAVASCQAAGVFDLSGNLKEWTAAGEATLAPVRGGGFETNPEAGLRCDERGDLKPPTYTGEAVGFRCCRTLP